MTGVQTCALPIFGYAEVKALAVGNPLVKERVETANELSRYLALQRKTVEARLRLENELRELLGKIDHQRSLITKAENDKEFAERTAKDVPIPVTAAEKKALQERRRLLRASIRSALTENELKPAERILMDYRGFKIVLPANMTKEKPFLYIQRSGKYYVEAGETELGVLVRIDNFIDNLDKHTEKLREGLDVLILRDKAIRAELENKESYTDEIEELKRKLEKIDKKLGVDKDGK